MMRALWNLPLSWEELAELVLRGSLPSGRGELGDLKISPPGREAMDGGGNRRPERSVAFQRQQEDLLQSGASRFVRIGPLG
jgi:hypothetical protein